MTSSKDITKTVLYRWFQQVWNQDNEAAIDALMTDQAIAHGLMQDNLSKGPAGFKVFFHGFRQNFSDISINVEDVMSDGDRECARMTVQAKHIESGTSVSFSGMCWVVIENGKIAQAWNNYDFQEMNRQIGVMSH